MRAGCCGSTTTPSSSPCPSRRPTTTQWADDIADIPAVLRTQMRDWDDPVHSYNRMTAWAFASRLQARLGRTDGSVDLLITGCEVSLWLGEQFAADVHLAFPRLKVVTISNPYPDLNPNPDPDPNPNQVVTISANKLLGQLGQQFPVPQAGFLLRALGLQPGCIWLQPALPTVAGGLPLPRREPFLPQERRAAADTLGRHLRHPRVRQHAQGLHPRPLRRHQRVGHAGSHSKYDRGKQSHSK